MAAPARRPARLPRAERRGQLLEVARVVFAAQGYAGTSMDEIAERADVSKPVVYQHFGGKQELFLELLDAEVERLRALIVEGIASTQDNRTRARSAVHAVFRYMDSPTSDHRIVFESGAEHDPEVAVRVEAVRAGIAALITQILAETTYVVGTTAQVVARGVVEMVLGAAVHWADRVERAGRPTAAKAAEAVENVLWLGLDAIPDRVDGAS